MSKPAREDAYFLSWEINTRVYTASINPEKFNSKTLIAQLGEAWKEYYRSAGTGYRASLAGTTAIKSVARFLADSSDRFLTLESDDPQVVQRLVAWERHMIRTSEVGSHTPRRNGVTVRKIVSYYLASKSLAAPRIEHWAESPALQYFEEDSRQPLDEFSNAERISIERACREIVRSSESLLRLGEKLIAVGKDPRHHGWDDLPNLLWGLRHLPMSSLPRKTPTVALMNSAWKNLLRVAPEAASYCKSVPGNPIFGMVVPNSLVLTAMRVLIHLRTDLTPEETLGLRRDQVIIEEQYVRLQTTKNRAHKVRYRTLDRTSPRAAGWKPGDVFVRAAEAMRISRAVCGDAQSFWIGSMQKFSQHPQSRFGVYPPWLTPLTGGARYNLHQVINFSGIDISAPHDLRRCRKTAKSAKAVLVGTLNGAAGGDHSVEVFRNHYAQSTTVQTIAAHTVLDTQLRVMDKVGPKFIASESSTLAASGGSGDVVQAAKTMTQESSLDKELSLTACADPMSPPHKTQRELCMEAPNYCLACSNAIIFKDHLPRLLEYQRQLKILAKEISPSQFQAQYGQQQRNLEVILSKFDDKQLHDASEANASVRQSIEKRDLR